ncbi:unnamed protein product, partial [Brenthis ino]
MRNYKRKTERGTTSKEVYESAGAEVLQNKMSIRSASEMFNLCPMSLSRYVRKNKNNESCLLGYVKPRLIFSQETEHELASYLLKRSEIYFGLLPIEVRKLAYQCAVKLNLKNIPPSWLKNNTNSALTIYNHYTWEFMVLLKTTLIEHRQPGCIILEKQEARKQSIRTRRKRKSAVLTDTPEKDSLKKSMKKNWPRPKNV